MLTADNLTDAQIRDLGARSVATGDYLTAMWCDYALIASPKRYDIPRGCERAKARAVCARVLNATSKETK